MTHDISQVTDTIPDTLFLVGDVFAEFARNDGVLTVTQLAGLIRGGTFADGVGQVRVTPGQGVSLFDVQYVRDLLARRGLADRVVIDDRALHDRAGREVAHKHRLENVLISRPHAVAPDGFEADLLVDAGNEVMSDHVTGQHIQGMLVMEAGRQMFIAVAEQFYLPREAVGSSYFVIDTFATRYRNFLFPLPAVVRCDVLAHHSPHRTRMTFHCVLTLNQGGSETASMEVRFTAFDSGVSHAKETRAAQRLLRSGGEPDGTAAGTTATGTTATGTTATGTTAAGTTAAANPARTEARTS